MYMILHDDNQDIVDELAAMHDVDLFHQHPEEARGVVAARRIGWSMWRGERWGLSVDAHTWACPGWDEKCIAQQQWGSKISEKPALLSSSPMIPPWEASPFPDRNGEIGGSVFEVFPEQEPCRYLRAPYITTWQRFPEEDRPVPARRLSMAFAFFPGSVFERVPWPHWVCYTTEEPWWTVAIYEAGYSIWHPQGDILRTAEPPTQTGNGATRYWKDRPRLLRRDTSSDWQAARAKRYFWRSPDRDAYHAYCGTAVGYPINKDWWR
ncbi:MAG: hypothetical protein OXT71_14990 [Acidobacteriota bacterium]|nr:hypothetical protein [Acidobacteriota bacterium]